jgi:Flp pilus assembly protein TadG
MRHAIARLAGDPSGNTAVLVAAALLPLLAMVGGAVDASRGYMAQARLQQACDAGVLAARKQLGSQAVTTLPADVRLRGERFFDVNFPDKAYGTRSRSFGMEMTTDRSIDGTASVIVPTTIMGFFNYRQMPLTVTCEARLNFANLDVMMVLDTTGSMLETNPGDPTNRLTAMVQVIKEFHTKLETQKIAGTRTRYGFVPYSQNVNVGHLLKSDWLADTWKYSYRLPEPTGNTETVNQGSYEYISGSSANVASYRSATCPASSFQKTLDGETIDGDGARRQRYTETGRRYDCRAADGGGFEVSGTDFFDHKFYWVIRQVTRPEMKWSYRDFTDDVSFLQSKNGSAPPVGGSLTRKFNYYGGQPQDETTTWRGCIEERATYNIPDYDNVDLSRALDLDIDLVPTSDAKTKWGPYFDKLGFARGVFWDGSGVPSKAELPLTTADYINARWYNETYAVCPSPARKLAPIDAAGLDAYLAGLTVKGGTYHDIGMLWGARLLSPTGLFASENADVPGRPTSRNLIFLTDGKISTLDISHGAYGVEGVSQRRWAPGGAYSLDMTVEKRFLFACQEARKRDITIWIVAFGVASTPALDQCGGSGRVFAAKDATQLGAAFDAILRSMGDLRISR